MAESEKKKSEKASWDAVDQAAWESFPSSDPPAHRPEPAAEREEPAKPPVPPVPPVPTDGARR